MLPPVILMLHSQNPTWVNALGKSWMRSHGFVFFSLSPAFALSPARARVPEGVRRRCEVCPAALPLGFWLLVARLARLLARLAFGFGFWLLLALVFVRFGLDLV